MRTLAYLLGSRALDLALARSDGAIRPGPEPVLPPLATTPETAAAWRRWAKAAPIDPALDPGAQPAAAARRVSRAPV